VPIALMLATLTDRRDFGEDWLLERKFDGERCVTRKAGGEVRLESRTAKDLTGTYPEVRSALARQQHRDLVLDGEVVAFDGEQTSFSRLQQRLGVTNPSAERVAIPRVAAQRSWREKRFAQACRAGWEGLIAKRAAAPYVSGRSRDWLKLKCEGAGRPRTMCRKPASIASPIASRVLPGCLVGDRQVDRAGDRGGVAADLGAVAVQQRAAAMTSSMSPPGMFHRSACSATTRSRAAERPPIMIGGCGRWTGLGLQNAPVRWT
jgi:hypothetical protein